MFKDGFLGFASAMIYSIFSFTDVELIGMVAGEYSVSASAHCHLEFVLGFLYYSTSE